LPPKYSFRSIAEKKHDRYLWIKAEAMKIKLNFLLFTIGVILFLLAFTGVNAQTRYAFVTSIEWDTRYDEPGQNGYVDITTGIVAYNCNISENNIRHQFIEFYRGEIASRRKSLAFNATTTAVWSYATYDEALTSRREWLASRYRSTYKRRIENFEVSCK
jgi:hypothetical protein